MVRVGFKTFCHQADWPALEATWGLGGQLDVFESAWLNDHLGDFSFERGGPAFEALTLLAALARHVPGKWIGHLALSNTFRHPAIVARAALTMDHVTRAGSSSGSGPGGTRGSTRRTGSSFRRSGSASTSWATRRGSCVPCSVKRGGALPAWTSRRAR